MSSARTQLLSAQIARSRVPDGIDVSGARRSVEYDRAEMEDDVGVLRKVALFSGFSDRDLRRLARTMRERVFPEGEIISEGKGGVGFFVIESGQASVSVGGKEVAKLGPGDYFGELALIDNGPRSASVRAESELRCQAMAAWNFRPLVQSHAEMAWPLLEALVAKLRAAEQRAI